MLLRSLLFALLLQDGAIVGAKPSPVVQTANGPVRGFNRNSSRDTDGVEVSTFWGLPFADPPIGDNRFRAPQPLSRNWTQTLDATTQSTMCIQSAPKGGGDVLGSEDCLYLNVYAPTTAVGKSNLPVMVWIYGGGYVIGDAYFNVPTQDVSLYDGAALAGRHNVVVVTMGYRVGPLGFFASEDLRAEDTEGSTGNMALRDQRAAMQWVQDNIKSFGGDPTAVTLFGESAGGFSVVWHLVSEPSWPLFHKAIIESGTSKLSWFFQPYANHAQEFYKQFAQKIGCPEGPRQLSCLRSVNSSLLASPPANITISAPSYDPTAQVTGGGFPCGPAIDGSKAGLPGVPINLAQSGKFNKVPIILGACQDGGTYFEQMVNEIVPGLKPPWAKTKEDVILALNWSWVPQDSDKVVAAYPDSEFRSGLLRKVDYKSMLSRVLRDMTFQCSDRALANAWAAHNVPVFMYTFDLPLGDIAKISGLGDMHGCEMTFVWRHFLWLPFFKGAPETMADIISCKWTTFAHTSTPEGHGASSLPPHCSEVHSKYAAWPQYTAKSRQYYSLNVPPKVVPLRKDNTWPDDAFPSDQRCDMWDTMHFPWHPQPHTHRIDERAFNI